MRESSQSRINYQWARCARLIEDVEHSLGTEEWVQFLLLARARLELWPLRDDPADVD